MIQLGQYPAASHVVAHLSDTHLLAGGGPLYGSVDTVGHLGRALASLERSTAKPQAIVVTGDLADLGERHAYRRLRSVVEPAAERMGAQIIWVMGNHDERADYSRELFGEAPDSPGPHADAARGDRSEPEPDAKPDATATRGDRSEPGSDTKSEPDAALNAVFTGPQNRVYDIDGLRVISFDSTVPGYHHGDVTPGQLDWLAATLATRAPHGTLLAMHHPPIPTPLLEAMGILELRHQPELAAVLRGSDVRAILAGHLHYPTHSTFAGIPVSVASATCYTLDLSAGDRLLSGVDAGQSINVVHVYREQVVHSVIPVADTTEVTGYPATVWAAIEAMTPEERLEALSSKASTFGQPAA